MITNINEGICHWRLTNNQPYFFVNWQEDGTQNYRYFETRYACFAFFNELRRRSQHELA